MIRRKDNYDNILKKRQVTFESPTHLYGISNFWWVNSSIHPK